MPLPATLTPLQTAAWRSAVDSLPAEWFSQEHAPLLIAYAQHVARRQELEALIATVDPSEDLRQYAKLVSLIAIEAGSVLRYARSLRIPPHTRLKAETAQTMSEHERRRRDVPKPWAWGA